ncbi:MAG: TonB-dependent siderophore receptor [Tepidimonas sp.]|uniref:TonB-dependent receptor n=1 Tax=Tepidimonas sp. TaxID=2002775 RepID=UPI00298F2CE6|nr:TonB-dependent siderophore receptor [Tepidimonas sp.]MDW8335954.1 TonB-dependent siderophore receptor [Tepidimonas sp.]
MQTDTPFRSTSTLPLRPPILPLGAALLAASLQATAQPTQPAPETPATGTLATVTVQDKAEKPEGKDTVRATSITLGKGEQQLRDIPQSVTVITEKLLDDRDFDNLKEVLRTTGGISFVAAEGGEEDIRLRGFSLAGTGDIFVDGMRDPAFYDRDTFNLERIEILKGSASMLFGRGSTGGAVNMVNKQARLIDAHQVDVTLGSHQMRRVVGDFNLKTGDTAALRLNAMVHTADNDGAGNRIDKRGLAADYRWGIGERHEFGASVYALENRHGINYGLPWIRPTSTSPASTTTVLPLDPKAYYGMDSDRNHGNAYYVTLRHTYRFDADNELTTKLRRGHYERDLRASTIRFAAAAQQPGGQAASLATFGPNTVFTRGTPLKIQDLDTTYLQSDYSGKFTAWGLKHEVLAGLDVHQEKRKVYAARSAAQGGVNLTKPTITVGGATSSNSINEDSRVLRLANEYESRGVGVYAQDLLQIAPQWKVLFGLRFDNLEGEYTTYTIPTNAPGPVTTAFYRMKVNEWSKRLGLLWQPDDRSTYYIGAANSFNTSGDAYSLSPQNVNTPPEESINVEVGAKWDSPNKQWTYRVAAFRTTKLRERNLDPLLDIFLLSGKRHVAGMEFETAGRITPRWEIFANYVWLPVAKIDIGSTTGGEAQGARPSQTPYHSGSIWTTYQIDEQWRVGAGLNFRGRQTPLRNPGWQVPSWVTLDLMAEYTVIPERFSIKANLTNATNKLYADQLYPGHYVPGQGRVLAVTASMKF